MLVDLHCRRTLTPRYLIEQALCSFTPHDGKVVPSVSLGLKPQNFCGVSILLQMGAGHELHVQDWLMRPVVELSTTCYEMVEPQGIAP